MNKIKKFLDSKVFIFRAERVLQKKKFLTARTVAFLGMYFAIILVLNFTPQVGYVNIGISAFTTIVIPVTFMSIHFGWKGTIIGWTLFGILYFSQVAMTFAGVLGVIGWNGAFLVYFVGKLLTGFIMAGIIVLLDQIEKRLNNQVLKNRNIWLSIKVVIVAILGSVINGFLFMGLWYLADPTKSVATLLIFLPSFGIAFGIESCLTITTGIAAIPFLKHMKNVEENIKQNTH